MGVYYLNKDLDPINEFGIDEETKEILSQWVPKESKPQAKNKFNSNTLTDDEYKEYKEVINTLRTTEDYKVYKKNFEKLCKFCHIAPEGTIIIKINISRGAKEDRNSLFVEYSYSNRKVPVPDGVKLYHSSTVDDIKELIPVFRGKSQRGYLYYKPRIYLTIHKTLPKLSLDYGFGDKLSVYEVNNNPKQVFIDPLLNVQINGAVYVETNDPLPVTKIK
jgi:hypothetical protein